MTVFGGIAMTIFPMSCMLVLDFLGVFFEVGFYSSSKASNQV